MLIRVLLLLAVSLWSTDAFAGGCPACDGPAQCAGGFCVQWNRNPGCGNPDGGFARICCPGQGCNTFSGRPSCEDAGDCTVVGGGGAGGGTAGGGAAGGAAGGAGTAGGSTTGTGGGTSGTGGGADTGAGCHCDAAPAALLLLSLAGLFRRRPK